MSRLVRMDSTGHTTLAEWTAGDEAFERACTAFREQLDQGYIGVVTHPDTGGHGGGRATQVTALPADAELVLMRRPIAGG